MTRKDDPFRVFRFQVEFDGIKQGGFSRVKGLSRETKVDSYREGGRNDHEHKFAGLTTYTNLILERGLMDPYLWKWHESVVGGAVTRKRLNISLRDASGHDDVWRWVIEGAFPVKWTGTDLDSQSGQVLFESVEFAHHGIKRG